MITISIIGSGNVAQHLIQAFTKSENIRLLQVYSRTKNNVTHLLDLDCIVDDFENLLPVDLCIIAVSDDAIAKVAAQLPFKNTLVVHTSGAKSLDILNHDNRKGVFYPLQTFSKNKAIDFKTIPICLEATTIADMLLLKKVAHSISESVYEINSQQRKSLHVAAVFVCNFTNHLYQIGAEICKENELSFEILKPLIAETAQKVMTLSPQEAQTGPAKRNDAETIASHIHFLSHENQKNIYQLLTQSIIDNGKKL